MTPHRIRPQARYTLSPETLERLKELSVKFDLPPSRIIDMAVRVLTQAPVLQVSAS